MKVLKTIKLVAETKQGEKEVKCEMGIDWMTSQPVYKFKLMGHIFDRDEGNMFRSHESGVWVKIKDIAEFEKEISRLISIIRGTPEIFDQELFNNL